MIFKVKKKTMIEMLSQEIRAGSYEGVHSEILQRKKKQQPRLQITTSTVVHNDIG